MASRPPCVFDSSAILALLLEERGADAVEARLPGAAVSTVTLGETLTKLLRAGAEPEAAASRIRALDFIVIPWTEELVWQSLDLSPLAWTHGLSLADRACLALARAMGRTALTADTVWVRAVTSARARIAVELFR
ncbi:MAG: type II toxin-antitoxin system VapC family toxin [Terriglobales bacterium]